VCRYEVCVYDCVAEVNRDWLFGLSEDEWWDTQFQHGDLCCCVALECALQ